MQGHWNLNWPSLKDIEQAITDFAALGIPVMITELDITVLLQPVGFGRCRCKSTIPKF